MLRADVGLIGGTGVGPRLAALGGVRFGMPTPFGLMRGRLVEHKGLLLAVVARHAAGHRLPPHAVNYRAMAWGLGRMGVKGVLATAAVGSLAPEVGVGSMVACTDLVDLSGRNLTLFEHEVRHVDMGACFPLASVLAASDVRSGGTYVNVNGPRYETPAEILGMARLGDVVGMTAGTEAVAFREAGVTYGCLAVVSNLAAGLGGETLEHGHVTDALESCGPRVVEILLSAAERVGA
ncbi:MAG: MTAP family purine nucleoside phosphorylase [Armatimonadetes bacterium]|nr:MTAP family purine nucleoside phosphorylase [Armatimonadota bacterium]